MTPPPAAAPGKSALLVEDDRAYRLSLTHLLRREGYAVREAADGREALRHLKAGPAPDVILLDLYLDGMDGWEFRRQQLRDPRLAPLPVIVLSVAGDAERRTDALGAVGYLQKPVGDDVVVGEVRRLARRRPTVLVLEDDPAVRGMLDLALRVYGFTVRPVGSAAEAVEVCRREGPEIAAVLLDVQVPGTDGPATLAALRQVNPGLPCCFMTGNAGKYSGPELLALGARRVFTKPFLKLDELARGLWEVVRGTQGA